ncbi:ribbon-helix-helix protein, CopG family [Marivirga sp.]|uniref:ribbon-helix-helix protein, CopG family n=1 Tax=Marivirga sp. TaxID=2018662 RepID=UPI003DA757C6
MLTTRLTSSEEKKLAEYCKQNGLSKSQVVKEALAQYLTKKSEVSAFESGQDLFGAASSHDTDRSTTYKKRLKKMLNEKHSH